MFATINLSQLLRTFEVLVYNSKCFRKPLKNITSDRLKNSKNLTPSSTLAAFLSISWSLPRVPHQIPASRACSLGCRLFRKWYRWVVMGRRMDSGGVWNQIKWRDSLYSCWGSLHLKKFNICYTRAWPPYFPESVMKNQFIFSPILDPFLALLGKLFFPLKSPKILK